MSIFGQSEAGAVEAVVPASVSNKLFTVLPNNKFQPTSSPSLRSGSAAAELGR